MGKLASAAGEYVFDNSWASSYSNALGKQYYPKLQCCVPFTPATGARLLVAAGPMAAAVRRVLAQTLKSITGALRSSMPLNLTQPGIKELSGWMDGCRSCSYVFILGCSRSISVEAAGGTEVLSVLFTCQSRMEWELSGAS